MQTILAYVSAEFGVSPRLPTYSGGLGVLAGDHAKAAADLGLPLVGVSLWYHQGYGLQRIDEHGQQHMDFPRTRPEDVLEDTGVRLEIPFGIGIIRARVWRHTLCGRGGATVPLLLLDAMDDANPPEWQDASRMLYGGDHDNRLRQEALLGVGGWLAVQALYPGVHVRAHLNEGHTAFFAAAMLRAAGGDIAAVRARCHFTTHTPVPAGHDVFDRAQAERVLGPWLPSAIAALGGGDRLSMSVLALALSDTCNGVSALNAVVAGAMFPGRQIDGLTNGVHLDTWVHPALGAAYDAMIPGWRDDPERLRAWAASAGAADHARFDAARAVAKGELCTYVNAATSIGFSDDVLTIGFARRAAPYKRATLIFRDVERLLAIAGGRLQLVFAGKAHPNDVRGRELVADLVHLTRALRGKLRVAFLPNYSMWHGRMITAGVDLWLNNPVRPMEACGTSGMKATLNGVPNLSVLDGWWAEGCRHGVNGWALVDAHDDQDDARDADALYRLLETEILPLYYDDPAAMRQVRLQAVATAPDFSAQRMVQEYRDRYYQLGH